MKKFGHSSSNNFLIPHFPLWNTVTHTLRYLKLSQSPLITFRFFYLFFFFLYLTIVLLLCFQIHCISSVMSNLLLCKCSNICHRASALWHYYYLQMQSNIISISDTKFSSPNFQIESLLNHLSAGNFLDIWNETAFTILISFSANFNTCFGVSIYWVLSSRWVVFSFFFECLEIFNMFPDFEVFSFLSTGCFEFLQIVLNFIFQCI